MERKNNIEKLHDLDGLYRRSAGKAVRDPFMLTSTHVQYEKVDKEGEVELVDLCSRLEVVAFTRSFDGDAWGRFIRFKDPDGITHEWAMPMKMLAADGVGYREYLLKNGLLIEPGRAAREMLHKYLTTCIPEISIRCVDRIGWHSSDDGSVYVLPDTTYGKEKVLLQTGSYLDHSFNTAGTLEQWKNHVAKYAKGNSRLTMSLCTAFASTLLELTGLESGGIHFCGPSSIGKTTSLQMAASVFGGGGIGGYINQWRTTSNGLEGLAAGHCDALLCLDELSQVKGKDAAEIAYMLANGTGKNRAHKDGSHNKPQKWRLLFLSTGEKGLADKIEEVKGLSTTAGQEVRIIDVPADANKGLGVFENLHEFKNGDQLSSYIKEMSGRYYGSPIREFLKRLVEDDRAELLERFKDATARFNKIIDIEDADGQVKRVAGRFGLIAFAGELAIVYGILPLDGKQVMEACVSCFQDWRNQRGGDEALEIKQVLSQIRLFFEQHGESRFSLIGSGNDRPTINRAGYKRMNSNGGFDYLVLPEVYKRELCKGFKLAWVNKLLLQRELLVAGESGRPDRKERINGFAHPIRVYVFNSKIYDDENLDVRHNEVEIRGDIGDTGDKTINPNDSHSITVGITVPKTNITLGSVGTNPLVVDNTPVPNGKNEMIENDHKKFNDNNVVPNVPCVPKENDGTDLSLSEIELSPLSPNDFLLWGQEKANDIRAVPSVPNVPRENQIDRTVSMDGVDVSFKVSVEEELNRILGDAMSEVNKFNWQAIADYFTKSRPEVLEFIQKAEDAINPAWFKVLKDEATIEEFRLVVDKWKRSVFRAGKVYEEQLFSPRY